MNQNNMNQIYRLTQPVRIGEILKDLIKTTVCPQCKREYLREMTFCPFCEDVENDYDFTPEILDERCNQ